MTIGKKNTDELEFKVKKMQEVYITSNQGKISFL